MGDTAGQLSTLVVVRHGQTDWSVAKRHTGRTDIPLNATGRRQARALRAPLSRWTFSAVYTSPLARARETAELAGYGARAVVLDDLMEWDYGEYEGLTLAQIRERRPGWVLWRDGVPGGESIDDVAARAARVIETVKRDTGVVLLVAHGHLLRVLTACWLSLEPAAGAHFLLSTATPSELGYEHDWTVIRSWNSISA